VILALRVAAAIAAYRGHENIMAGDYEEAGRLLNQQKKEGPEVNPPFNVENLIA
jgi:hypothetical protein